MYCTILCNTVHCTILLYSSSCSSNLMKIIQHDPSPSPRNATCNQERGCSHHCGDRSTASVLNQRSTALESWRLEKCPGNSLKKLEKTAVFRRAGIPICQIAGTANANKVPAHFLYILLVTPRVIITMSQNHSSSWQASSNSQSPTSNLWPRNWNPGQLETSKTRPYPPVVAACFSCYELAVLWSSPSKPNAPQNKHWLNSTGGIADIWWYSLYYSMGCVQKKIGYLTIPNPCPTSIE